MPARISRRPTAGRWRERLLRAVLAEVLPYPQRFRLALAAGDARQAVCAACGGACGLKRIAAMLQPVAVASTAPPARARKSSLPRPGHAKQGRVALLAGCVNDVLAPEINAAAIRVLTRHGIEVVVAQGEGCCGSLVHHMGREEEALAPGARQYRRLDCGPAGSTPIVITASGCGTTIKDYGFMLRTDPAYAERAAGSRRWPGISANISPSLPLAAAARHDRATCRRLSRRLLAAARTELRGSRRTCSPSWASQ